MIIKIIVIIILLIALIGFTWACLEPRCLKVTNTRINTGKNCKLRILYFSDLHAEFCFVPVNRVISTIVEANPDIVIFGGDICNKPQKASKGAEYLSQVSKACEFLDIPFIGTTGNHDVAVSSDIIASCGFDNINGISRSVKDNNGKNIIFTGLYDSGRRNRIWQNIPDIQDKSYDLHICLSHNPDQINHIDGSNLDIMLSGHIHGGQVRTPIGLEFTIRRDELPKQGVIAGLNTINGTNVFISKGLGCVGLPFRIGSRPEINIIDLE